MTNAAFENIDSYRDIETLNYHAEQTAAGVSEADVMRRIHLASRDNGRTPFQWNGEPGAGFTSGTPWIPLNPNHTRINLAAQWGRPESIVGFYRRLIRLRKESEAALYGDFEVIEEAASPLFAYRRRSGSEALTVLANLSDTARELPAISPRGELILANYPDAAAEHGELRPWELVVLRS
jgi:oligo-1,6-glucosidase